MADLGPKLRFAADENFSHVILRGLARRDPSLDIVHVQESGLRGADDPTVLAWAAEEDRILLTHDVNTVTRHAYDRVARREPMPGVLEVPSELAVGHAIEEILLIAECSSADEWTDQVRYLPL